MRAEKSVFLVYDEGLRERELLYPWGTELQDDSTGVFFGVYIESCDLRFYFSTSVVLCFTFLGAACSVQVAGCRVQGEG